MAGRVAAGMLRWPEVWVVLVPALYALAVVVPPLLHAAGQDRAADGVFAAFRLACHQMPHRTLSVFGFPMAVCARCFAISAGLAGAGLLAGRLWALGLLRARAPLALVGVAAAPMALDGFTQLFGFRESTNTLRVATGLLFGGTLSFWTVPMVCAAFDGMRTGAGRPEHGS